MKISTTSTVVSICVFICGNTFAQETRIFNQNASRSNHTRLAFNQNASRSNHTRLSFSISPLISVPAGSTASDTSIFRGIGSGLQIGTQYYFSTVGLSFTSGFVTAGIDKKEVNNFINKAGVPKDQAFINSSGSQSAYLLLGPSIRFGNSLTVEASVQGGIFFNNAGTTDIKQISSGASYYRNEAGSKNVHAGFTSGIQLLYNTASPFSIGITANYMQTSTSVNNYDIRRRNQVAPVLVSSNIKGFLAGINLTYKIRHCNENTPQTRAQNNNTVRSNRTDNALKIESDSGSNSNLIPAINNISSRIRTNDSDADGTQANDSPQLRAQNNNTIRSNRTDNAFRMNDDSKPENEPRNKNKILLVEADTDGNGFYNTDITKKAKSRIRVDENGNLQEVHQLKTGVSTSRSNVRTKADLVADNTNSSDLKISYGSFLLRDGREVPVRVLYKVLP